ncbi:MAG: hypothetical protein JXA61_08635, partial [Bacteroidales bacterium]|nr:hypothetical protein [Bacteroidales bacterium]
MDKSNIDRLRDQLADSSRVLADLTANMVYDRPDLFGDLTDLTLSEKSPHAQRAARVIAICSLQYPELFVRHRRKIAARLAQLKNESVMRNLLKIYAEIPLEYSENEKSILVNLCFDFLVSQTAPVAIKAYSMDILYRLAVEIPEIGIELYSIVEDQMPYSSAGFKSKGKQI